VIICLFIGFILSFLVYKTGPFFIGLLLTTTSSAVIAIIFLLLILNFVFDRKNDKKKMIWAFILSIVFFGVGCGLISTGALQFNVSENDNELIKTEVRKHKMNDKLLLFPIRDNVKLIESDNNNNIKIEYTVNNHCELIERESKNELTAYTDCKNVTGMARDAIKGLNEKRLINISSDVSTIKVYSSKENINKLKANRKKYAQESENRFNWYDERISELEEENERLSEELNKEIDRLSEELNECRNNEEKN
jgi:signal transduction histidine kinase